MYYALALACSVFSRLFPLPCLAVGAATNGVDRNNSVSMFCICYGMDLGPLCYTGGLGSVRRATLDDPDSTACHFGSSLDQPRVAGFSVTMLKSV